MWNQGSSDTSEGLQWLVRGVSAPPFSLIQNRTDDFSASFGLLRRKALQPLPQTFATFASNVCILCLKRLQVLATVPAKHCLFPLKRLPLLAQEIPLTWFRSSHTHVPICPLLCSYDSKISLLCIRIFLWPWSFLQDAPFLPIIYNARFVKKM